MYNIKGPSKIVAKTTTRRGISQNVDNYRDYNKNKLMENEQNEITSMQKPTFHKKCVSHSQRQESISPQHEEIIKFIHESWNSVCSELDQENAESDGSTSLQSEQSICYYEEEPCESLQDFKPFDLESWWGKRLYAIITNSVKSDSAQCKYHLKKINSLLEALEYSIIESQRSDRQILMAIRLNKMKNESASTQLKELQQENNQLLSMIQQNEEHSMSRTPSWSTISMVNLQYKYEELMANYNGLLKMLEMRISDIRKYQEENAKLRQEVETTNLHLQNYEHEVSRLAEKLKKNKTKKNNKIVRLKEERETLVLVHNQLIDLLHKQCMERDDILYNQIKTTSDSDRALLLQEIRKNNLLSHENFLHQQEIDYLQSVLKLKRYKSCETVSSESRSTSIK